MLSSEGSATFFVVTTKQQQDTQKNNRLDGLQVPLHEEYKLWSGTQGYVVARLVSNEDVLSVLSELDNRNAQFSLVEFPGVLLPTFMPTLQAMQRMSGSLDLPFADILAPVATTANPERDVDIAPPAYASVPGFQFDLSSITANQIQLRFAPNGILSLIGDELHKQSTLDSGQAHALVFSLARSVALVQGPPGTGKSYTGVQLIRALIRNKGAADLGPILCVTFTNHSLDQSLERLLDEGVSQIIRIGGQSKSERIAEVNLRDVARKQELTKTEKQDKYSLNKEMQNVAKDINGMIRSLDQLTNQSVIEQHLENCYPDHHEQLFSGLDEFGFTIVRHHREDILETWLNSALQGNGVTRSIEVLHELRVSDMNGPERRALRQSWVNEMRVRHHDNLMTALERHKELKDKLNLIRTETNLRVLQQANIIGVTTSGLANHLDLLRRINVKVVLCEEAGEVLEAHLLTALLPSVEHAIMIGDQDQLRPHVQNYDLSIENKSGARYALDVSLFERLVQPSDILSSPTPFSTLDVQRRMHPSISQLVRKTHYPQLQDGDNVHQYPKVSGMRHRLFWLHHESHEVDDTDGHSTSHTNNFECEMAAALVDHLVKQGVYRSDEIAIITPYLAQLRKIRKRLAGIFKVVLNDRDTEELAKEDADGLEAVNSTIPIPRANMPRGTLLQALRIATVDNFQGEEAKVVVVSLVRSNRHNNPGFLRTPNRINVLLSRAQHGMYILGNANTTKHVSMWATVLQIFCDNNLLNDSLELCCPRHMNRPMLVTKPTDFLTLAPRGGCELTCDKQLSCGHACTSKCHSEVLHQAEYCEKPCTRPKPGCSHNCPLRCGDVCNKHCLEMVNDIKISPPHCSHEKTALPCYQYQDPAKIMCDVAVQREVPSCGHKVTVPCYVDIDDENYQCNAVCGALLPCGHGCKRRCYKCRAQNEDGSGYTNHGKCEQVCGRNYSTCKHSCLAPCHGTEPCPLCNADCDVRCSHAACGKKCYEPCTPCAEDRCASRCPHSVCKLPCSAPCSWLPCSLRCTKILAYGCQCPSVCGEDCPSAEFCQNCAGDDIKALQADMVMFESYGDINLDKDPCIFTSCGHVFTVSSMDGIMDMKKYYEYNSDTNTYVAVKALEESFSSSELKSCPACRGSLRHLARYGRIVRRAMLDQSAKRLTAWSNHAHQELAKRLQNQQSLLLNSVDQARRPNQDVRLLGEVVKQMKAVNELRTAGRYRQILNVRKDINALCDKVRIEEQPYQRVRDLVETARRGKTELEIDAFELSSAELQLREYVQVKSLRIHCDVVILSDVIDMHNKTPPSRNKSSLRVHLGDNRDQCEELIEESEQTASVRQEAEGLVLWAIYAAIECGTIDVTGEDTIPGTIQYRDRLKESAFVRLDSAEGACQRLPNGIEDVLNEIADVRRMLEEGNSASEMKMVVAAMMAGFNSTGHWYRCVNNHLFTVGECGMPMELAKCPACGEGMGGRSHRPTQGVTRADDIEEQFGEMRV